MYLYRSIFILICVFGLLGCSMTRKISIPSNDTDLTVIDYSASRRGAYLINDGTNKKIISEPAPDIAKDITTSLGLSADTIGDIASPELKAEYAGKVVDLASRSQTLQVLRESLFRLSEMGASSQLTVDQRVELFSKVLDTVRLISMTEFANSNAPKEVKEKTLNSFLQGVSTGTVPVK